MAEVITDNGSRYSMDNWLYSEIQELKKNIKMKDKDQVFIVDGSEGSGKSVFAMQLGAALDPTLCMKRVCFTPEEFRNAIVIAKKGECVIFDEAFTGLSSRNSLSEVNKLLVALMMEMRQKNLIVIIVMPTFFLLDKYVAMWRANFLFHVYTNKGRRGFWLFFGRDKKKILYLMGKQTYSYSGKKIPVSRRRGRFYDRYVVDEAEYRRKKRQALHKKTRFTKAEKYIFQRNLSWLLMRKELGLAYTEISRMFKKHKVKFVENTIKDGVIAAENHLELHNAYDDEESYKVKD